MSATLVSCSKVVLTHDLEDPKALLTLTPHKGNVNSAIWNHNNQVIASCANDGRIVLSHSTKGSHLLALEDENNKTVPINSVSFTSNSQLLASGGNDGILKVWDLKKRVLSSTYKCHFGSITSVTWNSDDSVVASASMIGDIVLHNQQYGTQIANFSQKGSQGIKQIKFSPFKKNMLGSAGVDGSVYVWDISSRQAAATFNVAHSSRVNALAFSSFNPVLLCSASLDMKINFYDINDKKVVKSLTTDAPLTALGFYNDGHTIVAGTLYGGVYVYDLRSSANVKMSLKGHDNSQVNFVDFIRPEEKSGILEEEKENKSSNVMTEKPPIDLSSQRKSISNELPSKPDLAQKFSLTPGRNSLDKTEKVNTSSSLLDPNNDMKGKFLNIEEIKRQAIERIERKNEKPADKFNNPESSISSIQNKSNNTLNFTNIDSAKKFTEPTKESTTPVRESANFIKKASTEMAIENYSSMPTNTVEANIDKIQEKTGGFMNKIENSSRDFSEVQKEFLKDCFMDLQYSFHQGIQNLHLELIRQFEIQQVKNDMVQKFEKYLTQQNALFMQCEELRQENERLKKTSF